MLGNSTFGGVPVPSTFRTLHLWHREWIFQRDEDEARCVVWGAYFKASVIKGVGRITKCAAGSFTSGRVLHQHPVLENLGGRDCKNICHGINTSIIVVMIYNRETLHGFDPGLRTAVPSDVPGTWQGCQQFWHE